jgi:hypothetical protein
MYLYISGPVRVNVFFVSLIVFMPVHAAREHAATEASARG